MALQNAFENLAVESKQDAILTELEKKADSTETQPVNVENQLDISTLATSSKQLPNNHDVNVTNQPTGYATSAKQLPDGHNVTVLNPTADPEKGLAKESKQLPDNHLVTVSNQITDYAQNDTLGNVYTALTDADSHLTDGSQKTQIVETLPNDSTKLNPSVAITEVTVGTVTTKTIQKTIGTDVYQKTVAIDSSDNSISISAWSKL